MRAKLSQRTLLVEFEAQRTPDGVYFGRARVRHQNRVLGRLIHFMSVVARPENGVHCSEGAIDQLAKKLNASWIASALVQKIR